MNLPSFGPPQKHGAYITQEKTTAIPLEQDWVAPETEAVRIMARLKAHVGFTHECIEQLERKLYPVLCEPMAEPAIEARKLDSKTDLFLQIETLLQILDNANGRLIALNNRLPF